MIEFLRGKVLEICRNYIIIDVQGIGIKLYHSNPLFFKTNEIYTVLVFVAIKENEVDCYGFIDEDERLLFNQLISVSGVGPKTAFNMIKSCPSKMIVSAINKNDYDYLRGVGGIGIKTSKQIILELSGKIKIKNNEENDMQYQTRLALKELGFKQKEIDDCFNNIKTSFNSTSEMISFCLKELNNGRVR